MSFPALKDWPGRPSACGLITVNLGEGGASKAEKPEIWLDFDVGD